MKPNQHKTMKQICLAAVAVAALSACQAPKENKDDMAAKDTVVAAAPPVKLTLKWETDPVLTTCESVLYDKDRDVIYVSNINGAPDGKDGNGFISKVSPDGKVAELQWAKGMDAPKGLGLYKDKLYVTDIDRIHEIDVKTGKIKKSYKAEGAKFLNDITVDSTGRVYISDSGGGTISVIENGKLSKWMEGLNGPNGLLIEGNTLQTALFGGAAFESIDVATKQVTMRTDSVENADGVEAIGDGAYLVSSWNGMVHHIGADNKKFTVLDLRADSVNSADIDYVQEKNLLLVPTFFKNTVRAYELSK
jgi:DNA-binding beta-propeller fold protein YncE